jgi:Leucine-rich repeat (LRR) protein
MTTLKIIKCPNLTMKPSFPSSLESLVLMSSNTGLLLPPGSPDLLGAVAEDFCSASTSNRIMLPSCGPLLKSLTVRRMMVLSSGWGLLQQFISLQSMEISSCNDLIQLPKSMQNLASLQQLKIWNCASLQILPDWTGELGALQMMDIRSCKRLSSLPQSMMQLNSLQYLTIGYCESVMRYNCRGGWESSDLSEALTSGVCPN